MAEYFMGEIRIFGFNFPPKGWAACNGQIMAIAQNQALFALLGTHFGGNGQTNFGLPNLQGRMPMGTGQASYGQYFTHGQAGGVESVTLLTPNLPQHAHTPINASNAPGDRTTGMNGFPAAARGHYAPSADTVLASSALSATGGTLPHENRPPLSVLNFCIATSGIFPSRG